MIGVGPFEDIRPATATQQQHQQPALAFGGRPFRLQNEGWSSNKMRFHIAVGRHARIESQLVTGNAECSGWLFDSLVWCQALLCNDKV